MKIVTSVCGYLSCCRVRRFPWIYTYIICIPIKFTAEPDLAHKNGDLHYVLQIAIMVVVLHS